MKNCILVLILSVMSLPVFAQGMVGTTSNTDLDFYTNNIRRGRWTKEGPLMLFGTTTPPSVPLQPDNVSLYCHASSIFAYPLFLRGGVELRSSVYEFGTTQYDQGKYARILMGDMSGQHASIIGGDMFLNAAKLNATDIRSIVLNDSGGFVLVGVDAGALYLPHQYSHFQVQHVAYAHGYSANIDVVTSNRVVTNEDYTIVADVSSASPTITLPNASSVDPGRIFIIKVLDTNTPPGGSITLTGSTGTTIDGVTVPITVYANTVLQLQFDGTNYFRIN